MKFSGSATLSAIKVNDDLEISGSVKMDGNFECNDFKSSGSLRGEGNLTVHGDLKNSGSFRLAGSVYVDGDLKISGSTAVDGEIITKGSLKNSGSLRVGKQVSAGDDISVSGSAKINGNLTSEETIKVSGSCTVHGNVSGREIYLGQERYLALSVYKHSTKIYGNVTAKDEVVLIGALVEGDVRAKEVTIGKGTEVLGTVYYVDSIEVHEKSRLAKNPIKVDDLEQGLKEKYSNYKDI